MAKGLPTLGKLKIVFLGSPEMAVPSLQALLSAGEMVVGVVTQPDKPAGRGREIHACAVAQFARAQKLPLLQPVAVKEPIFLDQLRELAPDLIVVVAYGQILPLTILDLPPQKCLNVHFSLLPKYRGAAPVQWALINGEEETGVTIQQLALKLDSGSILLQKKTPIEPDDTVEALFHRLSNIGAELLLETLTRLRSGDLHPVPQVENEVSWAPRLKKEDGHIDFENKATTLWNRIRGVTPWPGGFTTLGGKSLKVWRASVVPHSSSKPGTIVALHPDGVEVACGRDALLLLEVQLEGKKRMPAAEFLKGHPLEVGVRLG